MVFYRKFRPQKFSDIIGQEHIVTTLTNALATGTFSHGYLFAGPRGSGKTSAARVLAKALNCTGRKLGKDSFEPCNKCQPCQEITTGRALDIIEIDAASNRGIDEIRDLREKIKFAPTSTKYKVYIVDEVHMLTKEAFNALLKTLEEPPAHAIFIMATTEPQKVLPTILSRVQRFDFRRANISEIAKLLKKVAQKEDIKIDNDGIMLLSQLAFGSYRDALSLFGQIASLRKTAASKISLLQIQEILGLSQDESVFDFISALATGDSKKAYKLINNLYLQGVELETFTEKLVEILRKIALYKFGENQLFDLTKEQQDEVKRLSELFGVEKLMTMVSKFALAISQIKSANLPQLPLEMLVFEFTKENQNAETKENRHSKCEMGETSKPENRDIKIEKTDNSVQKKEKLEVLVPNIPSRKTNLDGNLWAEIIKESKNANHSLSSLLKDAVLSSANDETITLAFKFKFHADVIAGKKNTQIIEQIIAKKTGSKYKLVCVVDPELVIKKPVDTEEELLNGAKEVFEIEE